MPPSNPTVTPSISSSGFKHRLTRILMTHAYFSLKHHRSTVSIFHDCPNLLLDSILSGRELWNQPRGKRRDANGLNPFEGKSSRVHSLAVSCQSNTYFPFISHREPSRKKGTLLSRDRVSLCVFSFARFRDLN